MKNNDDWIGGDIGQEILGIVLNLTEANYGEKVKTREFLKGQLFKVLENDLLMWWSIIQSISMQTV